MDKFLANNLVKVIIFVLATFPSVQTWCQSSNKINFDRITTDQGLSNNATQYIVKDKKGYMWVTTKDGLNKYDGYSFKLYNPAPTNKYSMPCFEVRDMQKDSSGNLWIVSACEGLFLFNTEKEAFHLFSKDEKDRFSLSDNYVKVLHVNSNGEVWIGTRNGLNRYIPKRNSFHRYLDGHNISLLEDDHLGNIWIGALDSLFVIHKKTGKIINISVEKNIEGSNEILSIFSDSKGYVWVGTGFGLKRSTKPVQEFTDIQNIDFISTLSTKNGEKPGPQNKVRTIIESNDGKIWVSTDLGVYQLTETKLLKNYEIQHFLHESKYFNANREHQLSTLFCDSDGSVWVFSEKNENGIFRFDQTKNKFDQINHDPQNPHSLGADWVHRIYEDDNKISWFTTTKGISKLDLLRKKFVNYNSIPGNDQSLDAGMCFSIYKDKKEQLWIGTSKGLNRLDRTNGKFSHFQYKSGKRDGIPAKIVGVISPDPTGFLWIGYFDYKISKFFPETQKFVNYHYHPGEKEKDFQPWSLRSILTDSKGITWFGATTHGLTYYNPKNETFKSHYIGGPSLKLEQDNYLPQVYEDQNQNLWAATRTNGLAKFDRKSGNFTFFRHIAGDTNSISSNDVSCIYEYPKGILWVGTFGYGLNKMDLKTGQFDTYSTEHGLPGNIIEGILSDSKGNLWISTHHGLAKFHPKTRKVNTYVEGDGIQGNQFNEGSYFKSPSGELFFGGTNGVTAFFPEKIVDNPYPPKLAISELKIKNQIIRPNYPYRGDTLLRKSIAYINSLQLAHKNNDFTLEFTALHYSQPEKIQYAYILENYDENWKYTNAGQRYSSYTNLPPGDYVFKLRGTNNDGVWIDRPLELKIEVLPAWWQTWWFQAGVILFMSGIGFLISRWRIINLKNQRKELEKIVKIRTSEVNTQKEELELQSEKLKKMDEMKTNFFFNISHEFRTPLTLILGPIDTLKKSNVTSNENTVLLETMRRNGQHLLKLVTQLLDIRKIEEGSMKLELAPIDLVELVKNILGQFQHFKEKKNIQIEFLPHSATMSLDLDPDKIGKILFNLLSNAFKFTQEGGKIVVTLNSVLHNGVNSVKMSISDNGMGIPEGSLPYVFDRFYQAKNNHSNLQESTGLGLSFTKDLVKLQQGEIWVESKEGEGTTFTFIIPTVNKSQQQDLVSGEVIKNMNEGPVHFEDPQIIASEKLYTILIVEDNDEVRAYLKLELSKEYTILEGIDGVQGLSQAIESIPDLILSDLTMPTMDGLEFCAKVKNDGRTCHIPFILLTARTGEQNQITGIDHGADDYMDKPFNMALLKSKIRRNISSRKLLQRLFQNDKTKGIESIQPNIHDDDILKKIYSTVEQNLSDPELNQEFLCKSMGLSKSQLYRKIDALTGQTVHEFIRVIRLKKAYELLQQKNVRVTDILYEVGYKDHAVFTRAFQTYFGISPRELTKKAEILNPN